MHPLQPLIIRIFLKAPREGHVKTRLCPPLTFTEAMRVHEWLCETLISRLCGANLGTVELWCEGDIDHPFLHRLGRTYGVNLRPQVGADLGERMAHAISTGLETAERVIVVGADCMSVEGAYIQAALHAMRDDDVALGPARDGGFVLIGARRFDARALDQLTWGGSDAFAATTARLHDLGYRVASLEERWDIDTIEDLQRYAPQAGRCCQLAGLL